MFAVTMALTWLLVFTRVPQPEVDRSRHRLSVGRAVRDYVEMLRRPVIAWAAFAYLLMFLGLSLFVVYLPTWLERELAVSPNFIASLFLVGGIANVLTGPQAGRISDRIGRTRIILVACSGLSVVMAATTWVVTEAWLAYPMFFLTMVLLAMRISPFSALLTALVEDRRRGALMSLTVALGQVGFAFGGSLAGLLFAGAGYRANTLLAALSVLGMGLIVWFRVPEPPIRGHVVEG
jgi:predicted MFS family arabinose efflux permease